MDKRSYLNNLGYSEEWTILTKEEQENFNYEKNEKDIYPIFDPIGLKNFGEGSIILKKELLNIPKPPLMDDGFIVPEEKHNLPDSVIKIRIKKLIDNSGFKKTEKGIISPSGIELTIKQIEEMDTTTYNMWLKMFENKQPEKEKENPLDKLLLERISVLENIGYSKIENDSVILKNTSVSFESLKTMPEDMFDNLISKHRALYTLEEKISKLSKLSSFIGNESEEQIVYLDFDINISYVDLDEMTDQEFDDFCLEIIKKEKERKLEEEKNNLKPTPEAEALEKWNEIEKTKDSEIKKKIYNIEKKSFLRNLFELNNSQINFSMSIIDKEKEEIVLLISIKNFSGDKALDDISPIKVKGTIQEIENKFFDIIQKPVEETNVLMNNVKNYLEELKRKETETKIEKDKKEKEKKLVELAEKFYNKEDFDIKKSANTAMKKWKNVLELNPKNKKAKEALEKIKNDSEKAGLTLKFD